MLTILNDTLLLVWKYRECSVGCFRRQQWLCQLEEKQCLLDVDGLTFWASLLGLLISQWGSSCQRVSPSYPLDLVIALHRCRKINGSSLRKSIMLFVVVMIASLPDRFLSLTTQRTNQLLSTSVMILALRPLHESQEKQEKGAHIAWYKTIYHYHCHAIIPNFICLPVHTNLSNPLHDYHHTSTTTKSIKPTKAEHKTYITRMIKQCFHLLY